MQLHFTTSNLGYICEGQIVAYQLPLIYTNVHIDWDTVINDALKYLIF